MSKLGHNTLGDDEFDEERELALIEQQQGDLIDRFGHKHSEAILRNWTPRALRALGVRRVDAGSDRADHDGDAS